ncbi:MAG: 2-hydroxychromene-2-carboxylate isomerase [Rhodospirillaceae bacterium]|jgi:2-hydroxychromene-2-carboxylate isomerase|nr:2-hydroxychromene-2-carboxylate isomerase [Rhodospirillaceae bacterium]MBT4043098.1 2-hydroxychromene-2-carboxylate isomerase [Rhodospirillaceae bacterium]MBT4688517.1 2-hydroxychromene-2-carboxylate isomerase [Rhodospirillaceae bacterium]MBT5080263.1 2-hydroxychromene-2-carboxylate isomerase [Rhodospirillaceae bacterium]MBT5525038.1 2-hydroxychromene-2-carboxylate isomerase [Rhodospirillaceae bacterium]
MSEIEYFYSAHSIFAYLGSARIMEIAQAAGRTLVHRPIDLNQSVPAGGASSFKERSPKHRAYFFRREIDRWSEQRNAPVMEGYPQYHYNDTALCNGMIIAGVQQGQNMDQLSHAMLQSHWLEDTDLADRDTLARLAKSVGLDPVPLLDAAMSDEIQAIYQANTDEAVARSVFGSPTYFVDGDMFYGQDRLEMVERALRQPYAASKVG